MNPAQAMVKDHPNTTICGVTFSCFDRSGAAGWLTSRALQGSGGYVCVTGAHGVVASQDDGEYRGILNAASMNTLDGQPVVLLARFRGFNAGRVTGRELVRDVIARDAAADIRHILFGANANVTDRMVERMRDGNGKLQIDAYHPPFREMQDDELLEVCNRLRITAPAIIWVGISTPRQERLAARLSKILPDIPAVAIGAGFDFVAGLKPEAPRLVTMLCMEWLFRLLSEPRRLAARYAAIVPLFLYYAARDILRPVKAASKRA